VPFYQHHILTTAPRTAPGLAHQLLTTHAASGHLFGVFIPQIGLSANHVVLITAFPDEQAAHATNLLANIQAGIERHEFWHADPRPVPDDKFPETEGFFSHRWFDIADASWPRFRELSVTAWDNFEGVHDTRVIGFWRSRTPTSPGVTRIWLMAWYKDLAAWENSRWYLKGDRPDAAQAYGNFRARSALNLDTAVSLLPPRHLSRCASASRLGLGDHITVRSPASELRPTESTP